MFEAVTTYRFRCEITRPTINERDRASGAIAAVQFSSEFTRNTLVYADPLYISGYEELEGVLAFSVSRVAQLEDYHGVAMSKLLARYDPPYDFTRAAMFSILLALISADTSHLGLHVDANVTEALNQLGRVVKKAPAKRSDPTKKTAGLLKGLMVSYDPELRWGRPCA